MSARVFENCRRPCANLPTRAGVIPGLLVFGATAPSQPPDFELQVQFLGVLHDDISLVALYSAADVFVASSRQKICRTQ